TIEFEGKPAYQFALREITERVRLEEQLRQAEKLSALGQMISGVAHELNNPLASIKSYVDWILTHHELAEPTRNDLQKVAHESSRAAKLVGNFLSFARQQPSCRTKTDINQLIERVMELRRFDLRARHIEYSLDLSAGLPSAQTDQDKIQQVLVNLINNAMQAMKGASHPGQIRLTTSQVDHLIRICVEDNGPGVPKHLEAKIFEPFFTTKQVGEGTGLGLSIAHSIMAEHDGRLYYQTSSLGGACFVLELPGVEAGTQDAPRVLGPASSTRGPEPNPPAHPANILILDDETVLADMLGRIVSHLGHHTTLCYSPLAALEQIERQDFDLVLSDYRMPVLDGQQFYRRAIQIKPRLASRIIFLTGDVVHEDTQSFLASIGNAYISKPFQLLMVEAAVTRALKEHEEAAGQPAEPAR
ncbi:MAG: ATP-binding protein, partial [Verrucomicrobia bacterium]|nr:ATP-binding protein [Verrucomicrobiota bacterium]